MELISPLTPLARVDSPDPRRRRILRTVHPPPRCPFFACVQAMRNCIRSARAQSPKCAHMREGRKKGEEDTHATAHPLVNAALVRNWGKYTLKGGRGGKKAGRAACISAHMRAVVISTPARDRNSLFSPCLCRLGEKGNGSLSFFCRFKEQESGCMHTIVFFPSCHLRFSPPPHRSLASSLSPVSALSPACLAQYLSIYFLPRRRFPMGVANYVRGWGGMHL